MYLVRTPDIIKPLGRDFIWSLDRAEKRIYLTFDDGPTAGITDKVLDLLSGYAAKATFFCLGKNVVQEPALYERIRMEGHRVGNHSMSHPDGWKTCTFSYLRNVVEAAQVIDSDLFRPPYGHITWAQASILKKKYRMVMWEVISGDFDASISPEKCLNNVIDHAKSGSIIVFHDSVKAWPRMESALKGTLEHFSSLGYAFHSVP